MVASWAPVVATMLKLISRLLITAITPPGVDFLGGFFLPSLVVHLPSWFPGLSAKGLSPPQKWLTNGQTKKFPRTALVYANNAASSSTTKTTRLESLLQLVSNQTFRVHLRVLPVPTERT
ncbi:hypothetical protein K503DRAFT_105588 [Rhizopogon vinicolor AM-OR11-026]|uniref:Uncharacterized protein n=1 Tax=Rhizopogon vinicolor AM-OR11-026 TaxID=1314800 RepID=A0A1B7N2T0_9AGAM|nr:hypothetical protein K503DRAFT_105588 [Rhizopogon vinicolor AM-OR11-026]